MFNETLSNAFEPAIDTRMSCEIATVTIEADMKIGSVLRFTGGKYVFVAAANVGDSSAILFDRAASDETLANGDHELRVANKLGYAGAETISFKGTITAPQRVTADKALLDNSTIRVLPQQ